MIRHLDHVAVAVRDAAARLPLYRDLLGLELVRTEEVPGEKVRVTILGEGPGRLELLEPTASDSPVARFLDQRGEGIHHLCYRVDSVASACEQLRQSGYRLAGEIRAGSEGTLIAFLHPKDTGGVLIELREGGPRP